MCYFNRQKLDGSDEIRLKQFHRELRETGIISEEGVISGFSGKPVAVLIPNSDRSNFDIVPMEWGFIPPYIQNREGVDRFRNGYKDAHGKWKPGYTTLNATVENIFTNERGSKSIYADAARERRCLLLSTGFFEWRHVYRNHKKTGLPLKTPDKYPYYINIPENEYFFMAGIYQPWTDKETGEHVNTLAITTTVANPLMMQVHNSKKRMPTILTEDLAWEWMMEDLSDERIKEIAAYQFPAAKMSACTIAKEFQALLDPAEPYEYADLPAIEFAFAD